MFQYSGGATWPDLVKTYNWIISLCVRCDVERGHNNSEIRALNRNLNRPDLFSKDTKALASQARDLIETSKQLIVESKQLVCESKAAIAASRRSKGDCGEKVAI